MNELIRVVGICHGLVFLGVAGDTLTLANTFIIFNPSMRKSVTLPKPTIGRYRTCIGFGFDAVTNDNKVVRFVADRPNTFHEDYSLAGGSWSNPRSLDHACEVMVPLKSQAFVNGAIPIYFPYISIYFPNH
ncbi:hypothetical protein C1H46_029407 [Malus baccata]|uniref:F-box associated beta-propeller type 3 domain-containing protein n=1 Tax=Malus baccata TaxID=106549 RepID=A0A540LEV6_MALBA|nr:hypothetical protein C1H46_029407 [Malus baccata]